MSYMCTIRHFFTTFCIASTIAMVGYWFYKFSLEDRDIGVVDYKLILETTDIHYPAISLCFDDIFLPEKLDAIDHNINVDQYVQHLKGNRFDNMFSNMNYSDVTINLEDYFLYGETLLRNETNYRRDSLIFGHKESFNGFNYDEGHLGKCFEVSTFIPYQQSVYVINLYYNKTKLFGSKHVKRILFTIHHEGQLLLAPANAQRIILSKNDTRDIDVWVNEIELLKSRNSNRRTCTPQDVTMSYDDMVAEKHVKEKGCNPPYFKSSKDFPHCNTSKEIRNARYYLRRVRRKYLPVACQRFSKIVYNAQVVDSKSNDTLRFSLTYPEYVKIITQSKEVDVHALIGNIGGYVGLILGMTICSK